MDNKKRPPAVTGGRSRPFPKRQRKGVFQRRPTLYQPAAKNARRVALGLALPLVCKYIRTFGVAWALRCVAVRATVPAVCFYCVVLSAADNTMAKRGATQRNIAQHSDAAVAAGLALFYSGLRRLVRFYPVRAVWFQDPVLVKRVEVRILSSALTENPLFSSGIGARPPGPLRSGPRQTVSIVLYLVQHLSLIHI